MLVLQLPNELLKLLKNTIHGFIFYMYLLKKKLHFLIVKSLFLKNV